MPRLGVLSVAGGPVGDNDRDSDSLPPVSYSATHSLPDPAASSPSISSGSTSSLSSPSLQASLEQAPSATLPQAPNFLPSSHSSMSVSLRHILSRNLAETRRNVSHSHEKGSLPSFDQKPSPSPSNESSLPPSSSSSSSSSWIARLGRQTSHQILRMTSSLHVGSGLSSPRGDESCCKAPLPTHTDESLDGSTLGRTTDPESLLFPSSYTLSSGFTLTTKSVSTHVSTDLVSADNLSGAAAASNSAPASCHYAMATLAYITNSEVVPALHSQPVDLSYATHIDPRTGSGRAKKRTVYKILVSNAMHKTWHVYHDYNEFNELFQTLKSLFPDIAIPSFPQRRLLGSHFSTDFLLARRDKLNVFLRMVMEDSVLRDSRPVQEFLMPSRASPSHTLTGEEEEGDKVAVAGEQHSSKDSEASEHAGSFTLTPPATGRINDALLNRPRANIPAISSLSGPPDANSAVASSFDARSPVLAKRIHPAPKSSRKKFGFRRNPQVRSVPYSDVTTRGPSEDGVAAAAVATATLVERPTPADHAPSLASATPGYPQGSAVNSGGRITKTRYEPDVAVQSAKQAKWRQIANKRFYNHFIPTTRNSNGISTSQQMPHVGQSFSETSRSPYPQSPPLSYPTEGRYAAPMSANPAVTEFRTGEKRVLAPEHGDEDGDEPDFDVAPRGSMASPRPNKASIDDFHLLSVIGKGSYGKVMLARHKDSGRVYAIKVIPKAKLIDRPNEIRRVMSERRVLEQTVEHPFLVGLQYAFQTRDKLYFCINYVNGGELFFHLQRERRFPENRARFYAAEITSALGYLHSINIVYRDLKPENCLLDARGHLRIVDFGLAKEVHPEEEEGGFMGSGTTSTFCGTPEYLAPEVITRQKYGKEVDWYCMGAVLYEMLTGLPPFYTTNSTEMYNRILYEPLRFPSHVSTLSRDFISRLMERNPKYRLGYGMMGTEHIKSHIFYYGIDWGKVYRMEYQPPFVPDVTSVFDLSNIDPEFKNEPIPESILKEGTVNIMAEADAAAIAAAATAVTTNDRDGSIFTSGTVPLYGTNEYLFDSNGRRKDSGVGDGTYHLASSQGLAAFPSPLPTPGASHFFSNKDSAMFLSHHHGQVGNHQSTMAHGSYRDDHSQVESATNAFKGFSFVSPFADDDDDNDDEQLFNGM